ncbi:MAG: hypothetical protein M0P29_12805 [Sphaerochaetaceae bacterium]|nr:hypothetical protein [Sphaerochaetaceae bacterium]
MNEDPTKHAIQYDLNDNLKKILFTKMLGPGSRRSYFDTSQQDLERPTFDLHPIDRALRATQILQDFSLSKFIVCTDAGL